MLDGPEWKTPPRTKRREMHRARWANESKEIDGKMTVKRTQQYKQRNRWMVDDFGYRAKESCVSWLCLFSLELAGTDIGDPGIELAWWKVELGIANQNYWTINGQASGWHRCKVDSDGHHSRDFQFLISSDNATKQCASSFADKSVPVECWCQLYIWSSFHCSIKRSRRQNGEYCGNCFGSHLC